MKKKIIHIHTDYKFIDNSDIYDCDYFENKIIIIQRNTPYGGPYKDKAALYKFTGHDLQNIVKACDQADLVILYDLELIKSIIAIKLPKETKIAWRFFGYELYNRQKTGILSDKSRRALKVSNSIKLNKVYKKIINRIRIFYRILKYRGSENSLFFKAMHRINFFFALSIEEYNQLSLQWQLPLFFKLPIKNRNSNEFAYTNTIFTKLKIKKENHCPLILIGNSRNVANNHLDIIDLIEKSQRKTEYNFTLLFNYGTENNYTYCVRQNTIHKEYFNIINEFMPVEKFKLLYKKASALVINSYRQLAVANIHEAFRSGVKVYLNNKNITLQWFRNDGFYVFSLEDFENDLKNNNLNLSYENAMHNYKQITNYTDDNLIIEFQKKIYNLLSSVE